MRVLLIALSFANPLAAQEIDYPALFAFHADDVMQVTPTRRQLELPGPVIITDFGGGMYTATDQSPWGAAGCAVDRVLDIASAVRMCPDLLGESQIAGLGQLVLSVGRFHAANTFPPIADADVEAWLEGTLNTRQAALPASLCADPDAPWVGFAAYLSTPDGQARMGQVLEQPRLPVKHPCP